MGTETESCYFGQGRAWLCEELLLKSVRVSRTGGRGLQAWRKGCSRLVSLSRKNASLNIFKNVSKIPRNTHYYKCLKSVPYFGSRVYLLLLQPPVYSHS